MSVISMKQLLEAGVHFGHQTRRWNPKMAPYIYTERNGIHIIDLQKSVGMVDDAYRAVFDVAADNGTILFVGTKKQAQDAIRTEAERCGMFYVNERWLGGMLTNCKQRPTKSGSGLIGLGVLEGHSGTVELMLFPKTLQACSSQFFDENIVEITGRISIREDRANLILVDTLTSLKDAMQTLYIRLPFLDADQQKRVRRITHSYPGSTSIVLYDTAKKIAKGAPKEWSVNPTESLLRALKDEFGEENIVLK